MKFKHSSIVLLLSAAAAMAACGGKGAIDVTKPLYTLTLNACNDSKTHATVTGAVGDSAKFGADPIRAGYSFDGWSTTYNTAKKMGDPANIVTAYTFEAKNDVLYGVWTLKNADVDGYMDKLKANSQDGHLYYHYYRNANTAADYNEWDVWAWPMQPTADEGTRIDWTGRTTSADRMSATGNPVIDEAGVVADIDLKKTYPAGWNDKTKTMKDIPMSFTIDGVLSTHIGLQIVKSETRQSGSGFWVNDGSNLKVQLSDFALKLKDGGTAYHVFVVEDHVPMPTNAPFTDVENPFDGDDGTNVTYGKSEYDNIKWNSKPSQSPTAEDFKNIGVGYQIMVSSFADSDGDGFGDIYGIYKKLDYLEKLGVKALWLTPIQKSDSYHGYDITDYSKVDAKFGSKVSEAAVANGDVVTEETAMADYDQLVAAAHAKGMKIVMDLVLNHTSTANEWFLKSATLDKDYRAYYQWGNHETQASVINENKSWYPYGSHKYSYYAKFGSAMPELNYSYQATRDAVEDMSADWVKNHGVDGFRLDAVKHIYMLDEVSSTASDSIVFDETTQNGKKVDYSSDLTKNLHFFRELKKDVATKAGKNVFFVGENFDGTAYQVAPYYDAFDSLFDFYSYYNITNAAASGMSGNVSTFPSAQGFMQGTGVFNPTGSKGSDGKGQMNGSDNLFQKGAGNAWNYPAVYKVYDSYRGDKSLPGSFTSNHDIARVINRIHGANTSGSADIDEQGNVSSSDYANYEKAANCAKIAEILFPGLTWIYYGDEIGMTGNFPSGTDAQTSYSDLWYRQPMKWVQGGYKGDGKFTTDYYVTGSSMKVQMDSINASTAVTGAEAQAASTTSDFATMAKFIKVKNENQALITGSMKAENYASGTLAANVLCFSRTLNGVTIKVAINFNKEATMSANSLNGTVLASYGNATQNSLPPFSAIVVKA